MRREITSGWYSTEAERFSIPTGTTKAQSLLVIGVAGWARGQTIVGLKASERV